MSADARDGAGGRREPVGPAREEAARLLEAVSAWAADALASPGSAFDRERLHAEGLATGSAECRLCPVCTAVSAARGLRPEVVEHLLDAGGSLLAALRAGLEPRPDAEPPTPGGQPPGGQPPRGSGRVERIDIG